MNDPTNRELMDGLLEFRAYVEHGFGIIDRRFDAIDRRFEKVDERFDIVDGRFDRIEATLNRMERRHDNHSDRITSLENRTP